MLKIDECFVIAIKHKNNVFTVLNSFFPSHGIREETLLKNVQRKMQQWYDTYYKNEDVHLVLGIAGPSMREGILGNFKLISSINREKE